MTSTLYMQAVPLNSLTLAELQQTLPNFGINAHQAKLVFQGLHRHGANDPSAMPDVSPSCKKLLKTLPRVPELSVDAVHHAVDGTIKLRLKTPANDSIESVIIPNARRVTLCVSSQVGCAAGCTFCHTGTMGLLRNLETWEIVEQHRVARKIWNETRDADKPAAITNIVFMGMGEPLHNEANVVQACRILGDHFGAGFSPRRLVVSTAGVGNRIRPLWETRAAALAVSLHATTDKVRDRIVPLNRQWSLQALREILLSIPWRSRESLTVAYLLLDNVNDSREDAERLAEWCRGLPAKINLLEFNPYPGSTFQRASSEKLAAFRQWLNDFGAFNTLRHSRGDDVLAACGQLATQSIRKTRRAG